MPTTARGIWTPSDTDAVDFTTHLATMANTIETALNSGANASKGTAAQRAAFLSTATAGWLWQDTDGIRMIWKRGSSAWEPAVWLWSGTTAQMNAFTQAPDGFEWFSTTDNSKYVRLGGAWVGGYATLTPAANVTFAYVRLRKTDVGFAELTIHANHATGFGNTSLVTTLPAAFFPPTVWADNVSTTLTSPASACLRLDNVSGQVTTIGLSAPSTNIRGSISYPLATP